MYTRHSRGHPGPRQVHLSARSGRFAALLAAVALVAGCSGGEQEQRGLIVGESTTTSEAAPGPTIPPDPTTTTAAPTTTTVAANVVPNGPAVVTAPVGFPDGAPYGPAIPFVTAQAVRSDLVFILAIGSDARPGQDPRKTNGDSLHLLAVDPVSGAGTVVGFPRDSWVEVPGKGTRKINSALALGGPELMAETVRRLTGLPVHYYVLTAFEGFQKIVDEVGGVQVNVDRAMNDRFSGARFDQGWHHMNGGEALAYARNRHDVPNGDFGRSLHQGSVMLSALAKMRAEVGDDAGLAGWIGVLTRHADLDSPPGDLLPLAALARRLDPARITNVVVPGRVGTAGGGQSVVFLGDEARDIFVDLRPDAVLGGAKGDEPRPAAAAAAPEPAPAPVESTTTTTPPPGDTPPTTAPPGATTTSTAPFINILRPRR